MSYVERLNTAHSRFHARIAELAVPDAGIDLRRKSGPRGLSVLACAPLVPSFPSEERTTESPSAAIRFVFRQVAKNYRVRRSEIYNSHDPRPTASRMVAIYLCGKIIRVLGRGVKPRPMPLREMALLSGFKLNRIRASVDTVKGRVIDDPRFAAEMIALENTISAGL